MDQQQQRREIRQQIDDQARARRLGKLAPLADEPATCGALEKWEMLVAAARDGGLTAKQAIKQVAAQHPGLRERAIVDANR